MSLTSAYSKATLFIIVIFLLFHGSAQQGLPSEIELGNQTCTEFIENHLGETDFKPPRRVVVFFKLFSRENINGTDLLRGSRRDESYQHFNPELNTKFIIHGFMSRSTDNWIQVLIKALLKRENCNVITVDWAREAGSPYPRAVLRASLVGEKLSRLIQSLIERRGADAEKMHLIGLSLGAQIAGIAGNKIHNIDRITGLDPAAPLFTNVSDSERLDYTDANFVDVIHTNADCLGAGWPCGHVDFYPNGGSDQPGCQRIDYTNNDVTHVVQKAICSHQRAADLFVESVLSNNESHFMGFMSDSYQNFLLEKSKFTKETEICPMGIDADKYSRKGKAYDRPRLFFLTTNHVEPFGAQDFNRPM